MARSQLVAAISTAVVLVLASPARSQCTQIKLERAIPQNGEDFGWSVAVRGDTAAVGIPLEDTVGTSAGNVIIYRRDGSGWRPETQLRPADLAARDELGIAVALGDGVVLVGAAGGSSAYVFRFNGLWSEEAKLGGAPDYVTSVALDGNIAVVGTSYYLSKGSALVFEQIGTSWVQRATLTGHDSDLGDLFGSAVAASTGRVMVGASGHDISRGKVYVFRWNGISYDLEAELGLDPGHDGAFFGTSIAADGNVLAVGAPGRRKLGFLSGSVTLYRWDGAHWQFEQELLASDGTDHDAFGRVALSGDQLVVGAPGVDVDAGAAYLFRRVGGQWSETAKIVPSEHDRADAFGTHVGVDDRFAIAGAHMAEDDHETDTGAAWLLMIAGGPASANGYGQGWPGTNGAPALQVDRAPLLGTTMDLTITNSQGAATRGVLILGRTVASLPTAWDGTVLVLPEQLVSVGIPDHGLTLPVTVPCDESLSGSTVYLQGLEQDTGASKGVSFTPGLALTLGF